MNRPARACGNGGGWRVRGGWTQGLICSASVSPAAQAGNLHLPLTPRASLATWPSLLVALALSCGLRLASALCSRPRRSR